MKSSIFQERLALVEKIVENLENHNSFWKPGWVPIMPKNANTNINYSGNNILRLMDFANLNNKKDPRFLTFKQIQEKKYQLKAGSKGCKIEYWSVRQEEDKDEHAVPSESGKKAVFGKTYYVFNADDIEGIEEYKNPFQNFEKDEKIETLKKLFVDSLDMKLEESDLLDNPKYVHNNDTIFIPKTFFDSKEEISALMHEMVHWTGKEGRTNRFGLNNAWNNEKNVAREELVAGLGEMFLLTEYGFSDEKTMQNNEAYIHDWVNLLKDKPNELFQAARAASEAAEYINQRVYEYIEQNQAKKEVDEEETFIKHLKENSLI